MCTRENIISRDVCCFIRISNYAYYVCKRYGYFNVRYNRIQIWYSGTFLGIFWNFPSRSCCYLYYRLFYSLNIFLSNNVKAFHYANSISSIPLFGNFGVCMCCVCVCVCFCVNCSVIWPKYRKQTLQLYKRRNNFFFVDSGVVDYGKPSAPQIYGK